MVPFALALCTALKLPAAGPYLIVHEATTCEYRVTWTLWNPPRPYTFHPDADGWISDHFIAANDLHGQVYWNVRTNDVMVKPINKPLEREEQYILASHAKATIFPALDLQGLMTAIASKS